MTRRAAPTRLPVTGTLAHLASLLASLATPEPRLVMADEGQHNRLPADHVCTALCAFCDCLDVAISPERCQMRLYAMTDDELLDSGWDYYRDLLEDQAEALRLIP